ncbi:MAG: putative glutamine amidotransferase [Alphaproteobacteria bacterium MarineAlpha6_Bin3]|nr:MAG: putative glutamine amidotransferase [Alphaproteobacteria bacterium MarineAlpha6_Bin3]|tara:strand:- start:11717 stop:12430 length:714 start_codon:yes stop_codon:yes gene_type:complete
MKKYKKPIIGISIDTGSNKSYSKFPWYAVRINYINSIINSNGIPLMLPSKPELANYYFNLIDGVLLTGGDFDIDPKIYGEKKEKSVNHLDKSRTNFEIKMAKLSLKENKPILGICGGQQLLNVALKGSLIQHIKNTNIKHEQIQPRNRPSHKVQINIKSNLYKIVKKKEFKVNSAHHQAIKKVGKKLSINAFAEDGIIEGIELNDHKFFLGIQWHPEFFISNYDKKIFKAFIRACQK